MKTAIQTASGRYFDFLRPEVRPEHVHEMAHALSMECRFGGHCRVFYSVAQHSVLTARLLPPELRLWGLLHDGCEAWLKDIPKPLKMLLKDYPALQERVQRAVADAFGLSWPEPPEVKAAELRVTATERRDVMPEGHDDDGWAEYLAGSAPLDAPIVPWAQSTAKRQFLYAYRMETGIDP